ASSRRLRAPPACRCARARTWSRNPTSSASPRCGSTAGAQAWRSGPSRATGARPSPSAAANRPAAAGSRIRRGSRVVPPMATALDPLRILLPAAAGRFAAADIAFAAAPVDDGPLLFFDAQALVRADLLVTHPA